MTNELPSSLLEYLPGIYQDDPFAGQLLNAFERLLVGETESALTGEGGKPYSQESLEAIIASVATLFDPRQTPDDFLPWLASWTAFTLRADLDVGQQRDFISKIVQLYNWRGTKQNLQDLLSIFTKGNPEVRESAAGELRIGVNSTIGEDTWLGGGAAFYFQVTISLNKSDPKTIDRQLRIARDLIELEKPAHTFYDLFPSFPSMQIGVQSMLGVDTLLGTIPEEQNG